MDSNKHTRNRRTMIQAGGLIAGSAALGVPGLVLAAGEAIRIGYLTPMTGFRGALGNSALKGALLAVEEINAAGDFYAIFAHGLLAALFAPVFLYAVLALTLGVRRFWREVTPGRDYDSLELAGVRGVAARAAADDALRLKYLDGGRGEGCHNDGDAWTKRRRVFHHLTFYGFVLCFAATGVATLYHYLWGWVAPYDLPSLPKLLGAAGGPCLLVGTAGLFRPNLSRDPRHGDPAQRPMDRGFIALLFLTALTGLALWWARGTAAVPVLLAGHLAWVMALFVTLPYGKFAHGVFRGAALLK
ncbi:MAG: hypothetical protein H6934_03805 [Burkholderiaceae bacterium]|nr:hypothetical protein [Burkholderiaceae bacterium]